MTWRICHKSGRVLFTTNDERTARNRDKLGWRVEKVDVSREQFEIEYSKLMGTPASVFKTLRDGDDYRYTNGNRMQIAWLMWQASREQLVVELPDTSFIVIPKDASRANGYHQGVQDCAKVLTAAGLTVKSD